MIKVLFFAQLREELGCESIDLAEQSSLTVGKVKEILANKDERWGKAFAGNLLAAVNQEMQTDEALIKDNDEVAFFPPVTGG